MSSSPRSELAEILFQEVAGYLPEISNGLSKLEAKSSDRDAVTEVHRLFHNIKGAASQVKFTGLSNVAAICESVLSSAIEDGIPVNIDQLQFISCVNSTISRFCDSDDKSPGAEEHLVDVTIGALHQLLATCPPGEPINLPPHIGSLLAEHHLPHANTTLAVSTADQADIAELHRECRAILRSVVPLLQELAECSPSPSGTLPTNVLRPTITALSTLAYCTQAAGFTALEQLLRHFLDILYTFQRHPQSTDSNTPMLVQEFLSYLDLIFSLPPDEDAHVISVVQGQLCKVIDSLTEYDSGGEVVHIDQTFADPGEQSLPMYDSIEVPEASTTDERWDTPDHGDTFFSNSEEEELRTLFLMECDEHVLVMNNELRSIDLEGDQTALLTESGRAILHRMRVAAHTLKGAAAMTGYSDIGTSAFSLEKLLAWLHEESQHVTGADLDIIHEGLLVIHTQAEAVAAGASPSPDETCEFVDAHLARRQQDTAAFIVAPGEEETAQGETYARSEEILSIADLDGFDEGDELLPEIEEIDQHPVDIVAQAEDTATEEEIELLAIFAAECQEHLLATTTELNTLTTQIGSRATMSGPLRDKVMRMRRSIHTLKGAAAMTGFHGFAGCAHALEDMLDWLHDEAREIMSDDLALIAEVLDQIEGYSSAPGEVGEADESQISGLIETYLKNRPVHDDLASASQPGEDTAAVVQFTRPPEESAPPTTALPSDSGNIRVKLKDLEELVSIEGELIVARGSMEKLLDRFGSTLEELNTMKETLRRKSNELEVGFEAQSLYGFGPGSPLIGDNEETTSTATMSEFDPIELDRYSQLNLIIRSLNELSVDVNAIHGELMGLRTGLQGMVARQQLTMKLMQEKMMRIRMTPLSEISNALFRTVRQTSKRLGKEVQLQIHGQDVLMDRFIWSRTIDPLMHILRNCIDHGIEDSNTRLQLDKPVTGQIRIEATQTGRMVILRIADDGRGVDVDNVRARLIADGAIEADADLNEQQLLSYLFKPSISTKDDISDVSGRGVGLDVVARNIAELRGTVKLINRPGQGLTFEISIPITLSVNRAIIIDMQDRQYAVPIQDIREVRRFRNDELITGDKPKVRYGETEIDIHQLAPYLDLEAAPLGETTSGLLSLVIDNGDEHIALQIDRIEEQREVVIKDLGSHLRHVKGISGVTLTGEGGIIPILNLRELIASGQSTLMPLTDRKEKKESVMLGPLKVLIVDDSISVRYSLNRLIKNESWLPNQAVDGIDALEKLETFTPDVIILDIEMPRMNGYEFMSVLRSDSARKDIPVVMLTSRASEKHRKKAEELGVNHYMTKPFQEDDFLDLLRDVEKKR